MSDEARGCAMQRRRFKQNTSLKVRLATFAKELKAEAPSFGQAPSRTLYSKEPGQADTASHIDEWANSPALRPPK
jgi:hypothetical protein